MSLQVIDVIGRKLKLEMTKTEMSKLRVLVVGCGNSPFSVGMYNSGFQTITSIDYSPCVINAMSTKFPASEYPGMEWTVMDMTKMDAFSSGSFDIVFDKAAMDALMVDEGDVWDPAKEVVKKSYSMCRHIKRVLVPKGLHLQISFAQPHFRTKYLLGGHEEVEDGGKLEGGFGWECETETIAGNAKDGCFHHFLYIMPVSVD